MNKEEIKEKSRIPNESNFTMISILSFILIGASFVLSGVMEAFFTNIITVVIPAYLTMRAIDREVQVEEKQWLTYWTIWTVLFLLDILMPFYLKKIPYYYFCKLLFLSWLFLPYSNGAFTIFNKIFKPYLRNIDLLKYKNVISNTRQKVNNYLDHYFVTTKEPLEKDIKQAKIDRKEEIVPKIMITDKCPLFAELICPDEMNGQYIYYKEEIIDEPEKLLNERSIN